MRRAGCHIANQTEEPPAKIQHVISKQKSTRQELGFNCVSCPQGSQTPAAPNCRILSEANVPFIFRGSSFPIHLPSLRDNKCSSLSETLFSPGQLHVVIKRARSLPLLSFGAGRPRQCIVFLMIKCAHVLLIITEIYVKGSCSPEYCQFL